MKPDNELPADVVQMLKAIDAMPDKYKAQVMPPMEVVMDSIMRRRRILSLVQTALEDVRVDMKYNIFDLIATRRERDTALKSLEAK